MKLLLLNQVKDIEVLKTHHAIEYFGPWAQNIESPDDSIMPEFEPYPNPEKILQTNIRSLEMADKILNILCVEMQNITGIEISDRFWRFVLGKYVLSLCGVLEDIKVRLESLPLNKNKYILGTDDISKYQPFPSSEFLNLGDEKFRTYLMLYCLNPHFEKKLEVSYQPVVPIDKSSKLSFSRVLFRRSTVALKLIPDYFHNLITSITDHNSSRVLLTDRFNNLLRFSASSLIYGLYEQDMFHKKFNSKSDIDQNKRNILEKALPEPYGSIISETLPLSIIECFPEIIKEARKNSFIISRKIKKIYTHGQAFSFNINKLVHLGLIIDKGATISSIQHGGFYGMYESHPAIALESGMIGNEYIASGPNKWGDKKINNSVNDPLPLPSPYFTYLQQKSKKYNNKNRFKYSVTFLVLTENRMMKWLYNPIFPDMSYDYFERERVLFTFFNSVNNSVVKCYKIDDGWGQKDWIEEKFPNMLCTCDGVFKDYALQSELTIVDYNSTGFAELLVMKIPFMATWSRRWFKGNPLYEECIDVLKNVGIFFEDPNELTHNYNGIKDDIKLWWNDEKRSVVDNVAKKLVLTSSTQKQCIDVWNNEFEKIL